MNNPGMNPAAMNNPGYLYPGQFQQAMGPASTGGAPFAGFGSRLGGSLLDGLLYGLLGSLLVVPGTAMVIESLDDCYTINDELQCPDGAINGGLMAGGIALAVLGALVVAFLYLRALGKTGQTWGRKIAGIRVVSKDNGQPIGFGRALGRQLLGNIVSNAVCYLGYLWMLWDKDKQTWHDKIVGSVVIKS